MPADTPSVVPVITEAFHHRITNVQKLQGNYLLIMYDQLLLKKKICKPKGLSWAGSLKQLWTGNEREWRKNKKTSLEREHREDIVRDELFPSLPKV